MAQAIGSNVNLKFALETTESELNTSGNFITLPFKSGESLTVTSQTYTSELISKNRGTTEVKNGSFAISGDLPTELGYDNICLLAHAVLGNVEQTDEVGHKLKKFKRAKKLPSFNIEKGFTDINEFFTYSGMKCNSLQVQTAINSLVQVSTSWAGTKFDNKQTSQLTGTEKQIKSDLVSDLEVQVKVGGLTVCANSFNFTIENGLKDARCLGSKFAKTQAEGKGSVSGQVAFSFENNTVYRKWLEGTTEKVELLIQKDENNFIKFVFPKCRWGGNGIPVVDTEDALFLTVDFNALVDADTETDIIIEVGSELDYKALFNIS